MRWQAKANVCNVRWHRIFLRVGFFLIFFCAVAVRSGVGCCPKLSEKRLFKVGQIGVSTVANKLAHNVLGLEEVAD